MRHYYMPVRVTNIFKSDSTQTTVRRWSNWVTHTVGENVKCTATTENSLKFLKKRNLQQSYDPATAFLDICPREMKTCTHTKACGGMFTAASCTVAEDWKEPKRPSMSEWLNKLSCTVECYLGLKRNKLSIHTTWMDLKGIMTNEKNPVSRGYMKKKISRAYIVYDSIYITFLKW